MPTDIFLVSFFFIGIALFLFIFPDRIYDFFLDTKRDYYRIWQGERARRPDKLLIRRQSAKWFARIFSIIIILFFLFVLWFFLVVAPHLEPVAFR